MDDKAIKQINATRITGDHCGEMDDSLAVEEPLEIRLSYVAAGCRVEKAISVTMRTPGNDAELAVGFLFTEGIIDSYDAISTIEQAGFTCAGNRENTVQVVLKAGRLPRLQHADRNFYTTSSCGVCGKGAIDAIRTTSDIRITEDNFRVEADVLYRLPEALARQQAAFALTGGIHASALFSRDGQLLMLREDVGRHNALDKMIGAAWMSSRLPLHDTILLLSGRASFELVQKAAMARIPLVAAIGAPSSLAVELAAEFNMTLAGFLRAGRMNIYTAPGRIFVPAHETTY